MNDVPDPADVEEFITAQRLKHPDTMTDSEIDEDPPATRQTIMLPGGLPPKTP